MTNKESEQQELAGKDLINFIKNEALPTTRLALQELKELNATKEQNTHIGRTPSQEGDKAPIDAGKLEKKLSDYERILNIVGVPKFLIDNPELLNSTKPTDKDIEWAKEKITSWQAQQAVPVGALQWVRAGERIPKKDGRYFAKMEDGTNFIYVVKNGEYPYHRICFEWLDEEATVPKKEEIQFYKGKRTDKDEWVIGSYHKCVGKGIMNESRWGGGVTKKEVAFDNHWILVPRKPENMGWTIADTYQAYSVIPETVSPSAIPVKEEENKDEFGTFGKSRIL